MTASTAALRERKGWYEGERSMNILCLSAEDIKKTIGFPEAIEAVREGFIQYSSGEALVPLRTNLSVSERKNLLLMPAFLPKNGELATKLLTVSLDNPSRGLPTIHATVVLFDPETGAPAALMEGSTLTALRTGAASGLATSLLARENAKTAGILGAGRQARTQIEAVCSVRNIETVFIYDISVEAAALLAARLKEGGPGFPKDVVVAGSAAEVVRSSDILCTATTAGTPVFYDEDLKTGAHINAIGSYTPEVQEIPTSTLLRSRLYVDSRTAALEETGDLIIPMQMGRMDKSFILGELGELASGRVVGRLTSTDITLFKSVGLAVQDAAVAALIFKEARRLGLGTDVRL